MGDSSNKDNSNNNDNNILLVPLHDATRTFQISTFTNVSYRRYFRSPIRMTGQDIIQLHKLKEVCFRLRLRCHTKIQKQIHFRSNNNNDNGVDLDNEDGLQPEEE